MQTNLPISVIVLTFNEEANIESCLKSLIGWAKEVLVVDSGSTDGTVEIVRRLSCPVYYHPFTDYSDQRNWAQKNLPISNEWIFHVDADERVTPSLINAIGAFFENQICEEMAGLLVRRRIEFMGRHISHGGIYPTYHCRIFRRTAGICENREYDQHFIVAGRTKRIEADLIEVTASSLASWTARHNRWAQMEALHLAESRNADSFGQIMPHLTGSPIHRRRWWRASVYGRAPMFVRSFMYFLVRYFARGGFLDGIPGLIYHVLQGFWFRFYVDACLYELRQKQKYR